MKKEELWRDYFLEWIDFKLPNLVERELKFKLSSSITAVIGPRRAGKTFYLYQIAKELINNGWEKENIVYIDFEDIRFSNLLPEDFLKFTKVIHEIFKEKNGKIVLLLDEIQNLKDYSKWLRTLYNKGKYFIFITGSSSKLFEKEIAKELRGRYISKILLPFSFKEFLKAKNFSYTQVYSEKEGKVLRLLREYFEIGGFPQVVLEKNKDLLKTYLETIFYRDVVERYRIKDVIVAELLRDYLIANSGSFFSISKFKKYLEGLNIRKSKKVLVKFYKAFIEAFFIISIEKFSYSDKERKRNLKKTYLIDLGFYYFSPRSSKHLGIKMEHVVAQELLRRNQLFYYYKSEDGKEIDFVTKDKNIIEVAYNVDKDHINKVIKAMNELNVKEATILSWDEEREIKKYGKKITIIPLWKWLLKGNKSL